MSLNDIITKIENDYKAEADQLKEGLRIQLEEKSLKDNDILSKRKSELQKENQKRTQATIEKARANWVLDWKAEVLKSKHEKLQTLFNSVKWKIVKSWKESKDIYVKLLKTITETSWEIVVSKWNSLAIKEALSESWKNFSVSWEWDFKWWFKVVTENSEYNFTLDSLMDKYVKDNELQISSKLFN